MFSKIVSDLPTVVPFIAPEEIERTTGQQFLLRLGANESTFGPSPLAIAAMQNATVSSYNYADPTCHELRHHIARHCDEDFKSITVGAGIDDLLLLIARVLLDPGDQVVMSHGGYPTFAYAVRGVGGHLVNVPYLKYANNLSKLLETATTTKPKILYLANPDNPTGSFVSEHDLNKWISGIPRNIVVIIDEAYGEFAPKVKLEPSDRVIRLRTFSKAYGMAGMRVGYSISNNGMASEMEKVRLHFGVNIVAQAGAQASLNDSDWICKVRTETASSKEVLRKTASKLGIEYVDSHTNFALLDFMSKDMAAEVLKALQSRGVFVRKPQVPPLDSCIRVTLGDINHMREFDKQLCLAVPEAVMRLENS